MNRDILMFVGEDNYSVKDFIKEAVSYGVSKRISLGAIPDIVPGVTRLFLAHNKARVSSPNMPGLVAALQSLLPSLGLQDQTLYFQKMDTSVVAVRCALDTMAEHASSEYTKLVTDFCVTFSPGVFGYCYLSGVQYVLGNNEEDEDMPDGLAEKGVEPVHIAYFWEEADGETNPLPY